MKKNKDLKKGIDIFNEFKKIVKKKNNFHKFN